MPLADKVEMAFVYGSMARGDEHAHSDVDVMLVGNLEFTEVVLALSDTQTTLRREVNPTVLSRAEFEDKLLQSDSFVAQVWRGSKLWVMGEP